MFQKHFANIFSPNFFLQLVGPSGGRRKPAAVEEPSAIEKALDKIGDAITQLTTLQAAQGNRIASMERRAEAAADAPPPAAPLAPTPPQYVSQGFETNWGTWWADPTKRRNGKNSFVFLTIANMFCKHSDDVL